MANAATPPPASPGSGGQALTFTLYDGSKVQVGPDGVGTRTDPSGQHARPFSVLAPQASSALGDRPGPDRAELIRRLSTNQAGRSAPADVVVALSSATVDGAPTKSGRGQRLRTAHTTDPRINSTLGAIGATSAEDMFGAVPADRLKRAATAGSAAGGIDLSRVYVVHVAGTDAQQAAKKLRATPGVAYAEPDAYVSTFDTTPVQLPASVAASAKRAHPGTAAAPGTTAPPAGGQPGAPLPDNFGVQSSLQSYLNASGVNLGGAYTEIAQRFGQLPGQGEIITNVSLGDLTDQAMADAGDGYVSYFGPTTVVDNGQRYLDYPSLPRIPTYTVDLNGAVDPVGRVEGVDPYLGEVLLDFSVMSPLPHDQQRAGAVGDGPTDLLGIAPGAQYRLVEPQQPTYANIVSAMLAAAQQTPKPDVITASLGFGQDGYGFPGRYLEDDPVVRSAVASIVHDYGIAVTISSNDGTRMYTPAAVGPDGGSAPTDVPRGGGAATSVADDGMSTTPSVVPDSGAITVGGTTLDDTVAVPPQSGSPLSHTGTFAETRLDGSANFSSGFGTRVNVSAPSDNIAALNHTCCTASSAVAVLSGGTSASAPMTAAAVADVLQAARLTGHPMTPEAVRSLLEETGRPVTTQPQVDRDLHVGPQIDLTSAVERVLGVPAGSAAAPTSIVRLSVAHRVAVGGAGASFTELTDPDAIDLTGPVNVFGDHTGEALVGPITIGVDAVNVPHDGPVSYVLRVGSTEFSATTPSIRATPAELLAAAGQPLVATGPRTIHVTVQVRRGPQQVLASADRTLTFGPSDGTREMAPAPVVAPVVAAGQLVQVHWDLAGIRATDALGVPLVSKPELIVSSIDHWSPFAAPMFRIAYSAPLTGTSGTVSVPASVFGDGAGIYGVAVMQNSSARYVGGVSSFRVDTAGGSGPVPATTGDAAAMRPQTPTLAAGGGTPGHQVAVSRADSTFQLSWDTGGVAGATGAMLEISAPGPGIYGSYNTFTNQNGSGRDHNGVDSGSDYWNALPARSGTATFDATKLGLQSSLDYTVRVFATRQGRVLGQASPVSLLEYDDGLVPGGATVDNFDINPDGTATVATSTTDPTGKPLDSSLYRYTPSTGTYGATYAHDTSANAMYFLYGSDAGAHRMVAAQYPWDGTQQHVLTYDTGTGAQVADVPVDLGTQYNLFAGRVDSQRHRAAILARGPDGTDTVLPLNTNTGALGTPVTADNASPKRTYTMMDIDRSTGKVDLVGSLTGDLCIIRHSGFATVDLDAGTASPMTQVNRCDTGVASDQAGHAEVTVGPLYSYPMLPAARLQQVDESTGQPGDLQQIGQRSPIFPVVDPMHHLLVVGFLGGADYQINNNAMSAVGVYDLQTGKQVSLNERFNLIPTAFSGPLANLAGVTSERGIQLDPATRTGWTFGPGSTQVQQFSY